MGKITIFFVLIFFVFVTWQGVSFYSTIKAPLIENESDVRVFLDENKVPIQSINAIDFYHGTEAYHIIKAINNDNEEIIVWIPFSLDEYVLKRQDQGLSMNEVVAYAKNNLNPKEIISIKLGMENNIPLYEITFKDENGRYSFYFIKFTDGTYLKHYHLKV